MVAWIDGQTVRFMPNGVDPAQAEYGPSVPLKQPNAEALETSLTRALLRARQCLTLRRLEAAAPEKARARAERTDREAERGSSSTWAQKKCAFASTGGEVLGEGQPVTVCDRIVVTIENSGRQTIMPALFFLDDKWNVFPRRPKCPSASPWRTGWSPAVACRSTCHITRPHSARMLRPRHRTASLWRRFHLSRAKPLIRTCVR